MPKHFPLSSSRRLMIKITSRGAEDNAMYSALVVNNTTSFCMELFHRIEHPEYTMMKHVQE